MWTQLDYYNARLYATQHLKKFKIDKFKVTHKHIFDHVVETSKLATHNDFYVPPSLAHKCMVYDYEFDPTGCRKIACFPFKEKGETCSDNDTTTATRFGSSFTFSCQPACKNLYNDAVILDTDYRNKKCIAVNHLLKYYALNPHSRSDRPYTLDYLNGKLLFTEDYCLGHGLAWDQQNNNCTTTTAQDIGEIFVGSTVYRSLNALQAPSKFVYLPPPPVPPELQQPNWGSIQQPFANPEIDLPPDDDEHPLELIKDIAKDLSIDLGVAVATNRVAHVMKKTIPAHLMKGKHLVTASTLVKSNVAMLVKGFGKVFGVASIILDIVGVITMIVDMIDPCGFNKVLTKAQLESITKICKYQFKTLYGETDYHITPDFVVALLETVVTEDMINFVDDRVMEYLNALDMNSAGQRIEIQKTNLDAILSKIHKTIDWPRIVHFSITSLFLIFSFFPSMLAYVIVLYIYYVVAYSVYINNRAKQFV